MVRMQLRGHFSEARRNGGALVLLWCVALQGLLANKDTHRPRLLQQGYAQEHRTTLGALCALISE
jgi:hypothetical protein